MIYALRLCGHIHPSLMMMATTKPYVPYAPSKYTIILPQIADHHPITL